MNRLRLVLTFVFVSAAYNLGKAAPEEESGFAKLRAVPFTDVQVNDAFWAPRRDTNRLVSIPVNLENLEKAKNLENLRLAAKRETNGFTGPVFMDSDVYKALEAVSYSLATDPNAALDKRLDEIISVLAEAQLEDGYLNSYYIVKEPGRRWTNLRDNHELYCAGHLFEAAVAHHQATGKPNFLSVATKLADHIDSVFGPGTRMGYPGHPEIELALIKLWRITGQQRYFDVARFFVENRGQKYFAKEHNTPLEKYDGSYWQDDIPIYDHTNIKGHAVRAAYLLSGVADVMAETRDHRLVKMTDRVWRNTVFRNMYITGGIGPSAHNEGFTSDYDLPNLTAYQETCASVALALWNHRLALLYGDARYADIFERSLYNGVLAGVSQDGTRFFYVNPLASTGRHHRSEWFGCACCPPNVARTLASIGEYAYAVSDDSLYVNLYIQGAAKATVAGKKVRIGVTTEYPWDGKVSIAVQPETAAVWAIRLRVPDWCEGAKVRVNGKEAPNPPIERGYFVVSREWQKDDDLVIEMPMPVRRMVAHPAVKADHGLVALQRGPLVYCLEACDQEASLSAIYLPHEAELKPERARSLLGGVVTLRGNARKLDRQEWKRKLYQPIATAEEIPIVAIPYYAWDNRKAGDMKVWLPITTPVVLPGGAETEAKARASANVETKALHNGVEPRKSMIIPGCCVVSGRAKAPKSGLATSGTSHIGFRVKVLV
jgi:DUF1680 family protein